MVTVADAFLNHFAVHVAHGSMVLGLGSFDLLLKWFLQAFESLSISIVVPFGPNRFLYQPKIRIPSADSCAYATLFDTTTAARNCERRTIQ